MSEDCLYMNIWVPVATEQDQALYFNQSIQNWNNINNLQYISNAFAGETKATMHWIYGG